MTNPGTDVAVVSTETALSRKPPEIIEEARGAAIELQKVIGTKKKRVMFNGEQYLEFEDWQLLGRFYSMTVQVRATDLITYGNIQGFWARADLLQFDKVISSAEAMCLNDEPNWSKKPLFQLRSMAQTRACAKALRNVLSFIVVLAGYRPTPAEELPDNAETVGAKKMPGRKSAAAPAQPAPPPQPAPDAKPPDETISKDEQAKFIKICQGAEIPDDIVKTKMRDLGYKHSAEIRRTDYETLCKWAANFGRYDTAQADYDDSL